MKIVIDTSMFNIKQIKRSKPDTGLLAGAHQSPIVDSQISISVDLGCKNKVNWLNVFKDLLGQSAVCELELPDEGRHEPLVAGGYFCKPPVGTVAIMHDEDEDERRVVDVLATRGEVVFVIDPALKNNVELWSGVRFSPETPEEKEKRILDELIRKGDAVAIDQYFREKYAGAGH